MILESEHGGARQDAQARKFGEVVDDALGDPVAQIVLGGVASAVDEGKDRNRVDRAGLTT